VEAAVSAATHTLTSLQLRIPGSPPCCSWLASLQHLEHLELALADAPLTDLMQAAAALPQLTDFSLQVNHFTQSELGTAWQGLRASDPLPRSLQRLHLQGCCKDLLPMQLSALTALTCLELPDNTLWEVGGRP